MAAESTATSEPLTRAYEVLGAAACRQGRAKLSAAPSRGTMALARSRKVLRRRASRAAKKTAPRKANRKKPREEKSDETVQDPLALAAASRSSLRRRRAGHAQDRDRPDQQLGEPAADARPGCRHLQEAQSEDRGGRHAGRGRDHPGGDFRLRRSRRRRRRRRRDARLLSKARRCASCCRPSPAPATSTGT